MRDALNSRILGIFVRDRDRFGPPAAIKAPCRILFCATKFHSPTLHLYFLRVMKKWEQAGQIGIWLITNENTSRSQQAYWLRWIIGKFRPQVIIVSRDFASVDAVVKLAKITAIPLIYQIDDDMTDHPPRSEWDTQKKPRPPRQSLRVKQYLASADVVYFANDRLARVLGAYVRGKSVIGEIVAASFLLSPMPAKARGVFGYMGGSTHSADLAIMTAALLNFAKKHPEFRFEVFGQIVVPPEVLAAIPVTRIPAVNDYSEMLKILRERQWDFAIAPLSEDRFNLCKSDVKWLEYSECGIPGLYSDHPVYQKACEGGAGILVQPNEWEEKLCLFAENPALREKSLHAAQEKLRKFYQPHHLRSQIRDLLLETGVKQAKQLSE